MGLMINTQSAKRSSRPRSGKAEQAEAAFVRLLTEASQRGYYGSVSLTLSIQDGAIQQVRMATDRMVK